MAQFKKYQARHRNLAIRVENTKEVAALLKAEHGVPAKDLRVAPTVLTLTDGGPGFRLKARIGDWLVISKIGYFFVLSDEEFHETFAPVGGSHKE